MNHSNYNYRIKKIRQDSGPTWIFLPDGPGLGSAYLNEFCRQLKLPGTTLVLDFPADGTNSLGRLNIAYWKKGLIELLKTQHNPILATHGFSGMFALGTPQIEPHLSGLILMNTSTKNSFAKHIMTMQETYELHDLGSVVFDYHLNPSKKTYLAFWKIYKHYFFTKEESALGEQMRMLFAYNHKAYQYAIDAFYPHYQSTWQPQIPTMTITGEHDYICPATEFTANKLFQAPHIINNIIPKAGHCPWLLSLPAVQDCFNAFNLRFYTQDL